MDSALITTVLDGVPLPSLMIGRDQRVLAANPPARNLFGTAIVGRHYLMSMRQPALLDAVEAALQQGLAGQVRHVITGQGGEATYRVMVSPVADAGQAAALCVFEDISEVEKIGQMRRDFVANVSHELRTPLTALLGFIETLQGPARDDAPARARFLAIMQREALRMNRLVRDLLSLSRVEAGERVRPTERVDVAGLATSVGTTLRPMAEAAGVVLRLDGADAPAMVTADADQMTQVLHNLIENAVKYGGGGKLVTVTLHHLPYEVALRGPAMSIEVADRGEGIDPIHLPRLTERFYRIDSHRSREKGGTGLGLAIVKHIVNRHRGRFRIDSAPGQGSRFTILLPGG